MGMTLRTALLVAAAATGPLALSACVTTTPTGSQAGGGSVETAAPAPLVTDIPRFDDPALQAVAADFQRNYAVHGADAATLESLGGKPCPMPAERAFRVLTGIDADQALRRGAGAAPARVPDLASVEVSVLSGECTAAGPDGPVVLVGGFRYTTRIEGRGGTTLVVTDTARRLEGRFVDGERDGAFREILVTKSAWFRRLPEVGLLPNAVDWRELNEIVEAPAGLYIYGSYHAGRPVGTWVTFERSPAAGTATTTVIEGIDAPRGYARTYSGDILVTEGPRKNGKPHGWQLTRPVAADGRPMAEHRDCFQNGTIVQNLMCPSQ